MKTTKKVLSVLLAVIMIMSSMSVCFGTISFAANDANAVNAFVSAVQCDAMKNMTTYITTAHTSSNAGKENAEYTNKWIYTAPSYEYYLQMKNVVLYLHGAIMGLDEYAKYMTHANGAKCNRSKQTCADTGTVLTALKNAIGTSTYNTISANYKIADLLSYVLSTNNYRAWSSANMTKKNTPAYIYNVFEVKSDLISYLKHFSSPSAIDADNVDLSYSYTMTMCRQAHGGLTGYGNYYHSALLPSVHEGTVSGTTTATNKATLVEVENALNSNKDYLAATTWADVHKVSTTPATLTAAATAISGAKTKFTNTVGSANAATLFDHYFNNDNYNKIAYANVDTLVTLINEAATVAGYKSASETIKAAYNNEYANEKYKTYTSTEVNALYNKLKTAYEAFKAADDNMEASIATYYGINGIIGDVPNALDVLLAYYYEIFLGSIDERAFATGTGDGYVAIYQNWTIEDIDNDVVTSADILKALNEVTLDIDTLNTDASDKDIQDYFGMSKDELIGMLTVVKTHLEELGYYAGLNDQLYAHYRTFTNNIVNVINADSAKLYAVLSGYETWHQNLQTFFTTWSAEVGEYKELLEDDLQVTMNNYMQEVYAALKARVVVQINAAYDLYVPYYELYKNNVTMASLTYFNVLKKAIEAIEHDAYNWMKSAHWTYGTAIDADSIEKYDKLQVIYNAYGTFLANRGFDTYVQTTIDTVRPDTDKDIARENEDDKYEVADEDIEAIIDLLEAALKDETIQNLLGSLINKDEDGNPTGEAFSIAGLINGLIEDNLYTDNLVSTIASFIYPIVAKAFLDVWIDINPFVDTTAEALGQTLKVKASLDLYDVEAGIEAAGIALAPGNLANKITAIGQSSKYSSAVALLRQVTTKTSYNVDGSYNDPWKDEVLFKDLLDEDGNPVIDEATGETKKVYALDWGVDSATDKKAAFIDAVCAALSGLEPLLYALLLNQHFYSPNIADSSGGVRGGKIGVNGPGTQAFLGDIGLNLTLDPITLMLDISACDGYDNVLAPLFEMLGLENIPHSEDMKTTRDLLEDGLFAMIDQLIAKLEANPLETLLDAIPNLVYALEADLIAPILDFLAIEINYEADAHYSAVKIPVVLPNGVSGDLKGALKSAQPERINVGQMLDLESMGINLSGGLAGILDMVGISLPNLDTSVLATVGELQWIDTNRSTKTYSYGGKQAAHIKANRADVLEYLVKWALGNLDALLASFNVDTSSMGELVSTLLANISANADASTAAIVELFNLEVYNTLEKYEWFDADKYALPTVEGFTPATQIYMNPGNDWTEDKAQYLYDNLEAILNAALTMAGVELDLEAFLGEKIDGLLSDKTLTALAALLAKLDLNALLNKDKTPEEAAKALDVNGLIKSYLGLDLAAVAAQYAPIAAQLEANEEYVYDFGVDAGTTTFAAALATMVAPLKGVLDFILAGTDLTITINGESVVLPGYDGYNNAIIPLLEALGCTATEDPADALEATINAIVAKIDALTTNTEENAKDGLIYGVIDMIPGILYFLSSNGLSTAVRNLLQPVYVILDTIRPIYDLDLDALLAGIEVGGKPLGLDLDRLNTEFVIRLACDLTGLNLTGLNTIIYDICKFVGVEYTSASTLQENWKKGAYTTAFDQADMLTVLLSFVLEWATVADNAAKLDEMLNTKGIIASLNTVFADVEIEYGTPNWYYWFEDEAAFNAFLEGSEALPDTLAALTYPNDWTEEKAQYIADNIAALADMVLGLIEINGEKYTSVSALVNSLIEGYINADTINMLLDMLKDVLANVDDTLLGAGYLLDVDLVGLKNYTCTKEIKTISELVAELAYILDTYAPTLVNLLFFGDDIRLAKKSDNTDTIVINGGLGYEKGLALILEALGCEVPAADEATTANVLGALAARVEAILADPVNEVIDMLPNLIYFLNADGATVAVNNLLAPVYAIIDKVNALNLMAPINLVDLLGFDLKYLSLEDIFNLVESKTGLDLEAAEKILVDLCIGDIEKADYTYKMVVKRADTITVLLTTVLMLISDDEFAAQLDKAFNTNIVSAIKTVFAESVVEYTAPAWDYTTNDNGNYLVQYPNNWTAETAEYVTAVLESKEFESIIAGLIGDYASLSEVLNDKVNVFTADTLNSLVGFISNLLADIDDGLLGVGMILDVDLVGLKNYECKAEIASVADFAAELANILNTYAKGIVEWLLLGKDYTFFVADEDGAAAGLEYSDIITITGAHGYAEGLALLLEALGCKNLPTVYGSEATTEEIISGVFASLAARIDEIIANPVKEVLELLPNLIYFLNTNGVAAVIDNTTAALMAIVAKLDVFGVKLDLNELVDLKKLMGLADTDAAISIDNLSMAAILEAVGLMVGLDLTYIVEVLVGFNLGTVSEYNSVSAEAGTPKKMSYDDKFVHKDMVTVLVNLVLLTVEDADNAAKLEELLGEKVYKLIMNLFNMEEVGVQDFTWAYTSEETGGNKVGETFSAFETSVEFSGEVYGTIYTEEQAKYIADNFGDFINNIIYLLGVDVNGDGVADGNLVDIINGFINGSVYTTENIVAIRDALAGILANIGNIAVNGVNVGAYIVDILKTAGVADFNAVADVKVDEVTDRASFVEELCDVLEPLYPVLKYLLADEDFAFFVKADKTSAAITLKGAEGYAYGIIPLLEALGCENVITKDAYYEAIEKGEDDVVITSILDILLDRVDAILGAEDPATKILEMLPNILYFINSNGVDTVVKNTLAAVYTLLNAIKPIAEIDLYKVIGIEFLSTIDFNWIVDKVIEILNENGFSFKAEDLNALAELTVGKLESYTSANGETYYRMVYATGEATTGTTTEMVTVIERLAIKFLTVEENQEAVVKFLKEKMNMNATAENYVRSTLKLLAECIDGTSVGMQSALAAVYYLFYGVDIGVGETANGLKDLNTAWKEAIAELKEKNSAAGELIEEILGWDIFDDVIDTETGVAPNGLIRFFQKIVEWFKGIGEFFKKLFSFGK